MMQMLRVLAERTTGMRRLIFGAVAIAVLLAPARTYGQADEVVLKASMNASEF
jgi:hypothetical protein